MAKGKNEKISQVIDKIQYQQVLCFNHLILVAVIYMALLSFQNNYIYIYSLFSIIIQIFHVRLCED